MYSTYIRYTLLSNHNIPKCSCGLYFWTLDPLMDKFYQTLSMKGSTVQKKAAQIFMNVVIWRKNISNIHMYMWAKWRRWPQMRESSLLTEKLLTIVHKWDFLFIFQKNQSKYLVKKEKEMLLLKYMLGHTCAFIYIDANYRVAIWKKIPCHGMWYCYKIFLQIYTTMIPFTSYLYILKTSLQFF